MGIKNISDNLLSYELSDISNAVKEYAIKARIENLQGVINKRYFKDMIDQIDHVLYKAHIRLAEGR